MALLGLCGSELPPFDEFDNFISDEYYWAKKTIRGNRYTLKVTNPLYLFAFLDLPDKVQEGVEQGFLLEKQYSVRMKKQKVREYARHPQITYHKMEDQWELDSNAEKSKKLQIVKKSAQLSIQKACTKEDGNSSYFNHLFNMDIMLAAVIGESQNIFLKGLEHHALLDCGISEVREAVCMCQNEEILSALFQNECTSFYIELEDALEYMNPVLLRLIYESGEKVLDEDFYDNCLEAFVIQYCDIPLRGWNILENSYFPLTWVDNSDEIESIGLNEWRTYKDCLTDFIACMNYLKMQGCKRRKIKLSRKEQNNLETVLENIKKCGGEKLYQEFLEIVENY